MEHVCMHGCVYVQEGCSLISTVFTGTCVCACMCAERMLTNSAAFSGTCVYACMCVMCRKDVCNSVCTMVAINFIMRLRAESLLGTLCPGFVHPPASSLSHHGVRVLGLASLPSGRPTVWSRSGIRACTGILSLYRFFEDLHTSLNT